MKSRQNQSKPRSGTFYLEAIITSMMLIAVLVSIAKYARHSHQLDQLASRRLATKLAGENAMAHIEALSESSFDTNVVMDAIPKIQERTKQSSGMELAITINRFDPANGQTYSELNNKKKTPMGLHVTIKPASPSVSASFFRMDRWILAAPDPIAPSQDSVPVGDNPEGDSLRKEELEEST